MVASARRRQYTITANMLQGHSQQTAIDALNREVKAMQLDAAYVAGTTGTSREMGTAAVSFLLAFALSIIFMYLVLAAQFESWLHPVTILLALPLTVPFALLSILIFGQSLNIYTALGLLVSSGGEEEPFCRDNTTLSASASCPKGPSRAILARCADLFS